MRAASAAIAATTAGKSPMAPGCGDGSGAAASSGTSAVRAISAIALTASRGWAPIAVSPESITASAPSCTAPATSETSARVGVGCSIIDSSICVATMTGTATRRPIARISRCTRGTAASPISTPRSPRATIRISDARAIASSSQSASPRSIFATTHGRRPSGTCFRRRFRSRTCAALLTNERPTKSIPAASPSARSRLSFPVSAGAESAELGKLTPASLFTRPPKTTHAVRERPCFDSTRSTTRPSSIFTIAPSPTSARSFGYVTPMRRPAPRTAPGTISTVSPRSQKTLPPSIGPTRIFGPPRSRRIPTGRPSLRSALRTSAARRRICPGFRCAPFNRTTSTPAESSASRAPGSSAREPIVATIFVARAGASPPFPDVIFERPPFV